MRQFVVEGCHERSISNLPTTASRPHPKRIRNLSTPEPRENWHSEDEQTAHMPKRPLNLHLPSTSEEDRLPSTSKLNNSFFQLASIPRKEQGTVKRASRSKQHSEILTSTPTK